MAGFSSPYECRGGYAVIWLDRGLAIGQPRWFKTKDEADDFLENPPNVDTETPPEWVQPSLAD